jgi:hypothetical protein
MAYSDAEIIGVAAGVPPTRHSCTPRILCQEDADATRLNRHLNNRPSLRQTGNHTHGDPIFHQATFV